MRAGSPGEVANGRGAMQDKEVKVLVLFGGRSAEHEVSVLSARSIVQALRQQQYGVILAGVARSGRWVVGPAAEAALEAGVVEDGPQNISLSPGGGNRALQVQREDGSVQRWEVDVVFPVLHGTGGEDGSIQGLLEASGLAYVGAGVTASALGMDKVLTKELWRASGLPVLPSLTFRRWQLERLEDCVAAVLAKIGVPCFVKPANSGSSVGISHVTKICELGEALQLAAQFDRKILVERACPQPRELEIGVIGNDHPQCSEPGEISYQSAFYDYRTKYQNEGAPQLTIPAPIAPELVATMKELALRVWAISDLNGLARIDFLLSPEGELYLNEVNTMPGFTQFSMFSKLWEASGWEYGQLVRRLIELALERQLDLKRNKIAP